MLYISTYHRRGASAVVSDAWDLARAFDVVAYCVGARSPHGVPNPAPSQS